MYKLVKIQVRSIAIAFILAGPALAEGTPPANLEGCEFQACDASLEECCQMAVGQYNACQGADQYNSEKYADFGKQGKAAKNAINECSRCSQVYVENFCTSN